MKKRKKVNGKYYSTLRFMPKFRTYNEEGLKKLQRELSLAELNDEETSMLKVEIRNYEKNLNRPRGAGDTGPR